VLFLLFPGYRRLESPLLLLFPGYGRLGGPICLFNTRFTVGLWASGPPFHPFHCWSLDLLASFIHPFHCWSLGLLASLISRFTVGLWASWPPFLPDLCQKEASQPPILSCFMSERGLPASLSPCYSRVNVRKARPWAL